MALSGVGWSLMEGSRGWARVKSGFVFPIRLCHSTLSHFNMLHYSPPSNPPRRARPEPDYQLTPDNGISRVILARAFRMRIAESLSKLILSGKQTSTVVSAPGAIMVSFLN